MKKLSIKRLIAYIIDVLFVSLIVMGISKVKYVEVRNEQATEYSEKLLTLSEKYLDKEITDKEFKKEGIELQYQLEKSSTTSNCIYIVMFIAYFTIFQLLNGGQTIGKKVMKIKIVSNSDKKLNVFNYFVRTLLLYGTLSTILSTTFVYILNKNSFYNVLSIIQIITSAIFYAVAFMVVFKKDGRGLHDFLANTKVVFVDDVREETDEEENKVIEAKFEEKKKTNKKSIKNKTKKGN